MHHSARPSRAEARLGPQELMSLFHSHRPDQREKEEYARTGGAGFMAIINEISYQVHVVFRSTLGDRNKQEEYTKKIYYI